VVFADTLDERIPVGAKGLGVLPRFQRDLHADLRRELVDLRAVHVPDDLIPVPAAAPRIFPELGRDACGDVVEGAPGGPEQRDLTLALGLGLEARTYGEQRSATLF